MWVLIIYIYAGMLAKGDSVALLQVPSFTTQEACMQAGEATKPFTRGTTKSLEFVCVKQ